MGRYIRDILQYSLHGHHYRVGILPSSPISPDASNLGMTCRRDGLSALLRAVGSADGFRAWGRSPKEFLV